MSWSHEIESPASAASLFKAVVLDWHNLGPKVLPDIVVSGAALEGDGGVGSVRQINFTSALPFSFVKERLDFIDHGKFESKQSLIAGGDIGTKLESASSHFKVEPASNGGSVFKVVATYKALPGVQVTDEVAKWKEGLTGMIKAAEAYVVANPSAYS